MFYILGFLLPQLLELENFMLLEWDLAQKPILGSYICQFSDGFLIPDNNHPLTHEIKPFDLILCKTTPIAIKAGNIKIIRPLRRINIKTAIELVWEGIEFVSTYIPFEIITQLKEYQIDELDAYDKIDGVVLYEQKGRQKGHDKKVVSIHSL